MSETRELHELLDRLVDRCEHERRDWQDVVRRAEAADVAAAVPPAGSKRRRWSLALALVALAALVALLATPAFGLREALLDLIGRDNVEFGKSPAAATIVKRQFADLAIGAPAGMSPQVIPNETRRVVIAGNARRRILNVAPTRRGGYCYIIERSHGGCQRNDPDRWLPPIGLTYRAGAQPGQPVKVDYIGGTVNDPRVTRLTIEFADGHSVDVPFTWISAPIGAGFFAYDVPPDRRTKTRGPRSVTAWGANGDRIARDSTIHYPLPEPRVVDPDRYGPRHRQLPAAPPVPPADPVRAARAHGVTVTVGGNNSVLFDSSAIDAERRRALEGRSAGFVCFRITTQYGATYARGYGVGGRFAERVGHRYDGLGRLDGCEIQGSYGHRWPDKFDSHSIIELPLNDRARRYFDDRAAARDIALFVRQREMQQLRRKPPTTVAAEVARRYPGQLAQLATTSANPPAGTIGYHASADTLTFVRLSETGRRFVVEIQGGKLHSNNLGELAMVF